MRSIRARQRKPLASIEVKHDGSFFHECIFDSLVIDRRRLRSAISFVMPHDVGAPNWRNSVRVADLTTTLALQFVNIRSLGKLDYPVCGTIRENQNSPDPLNRTQHRPVGLASLKERPLDEVAGLLSAPDLGDAASLALRIAPGRRW